MALEEHNRSHGAARNVVEATRVAYNDLRKSERKVADVVLTDPRRVLSATLAQAADFAGVSQPTVIRFCVAIGCSGFQEFKLRLAHSLALGMPATHSVLSGADSLDAVIEKIFDYTITSLDWARGHLDHNAIERAVDLLQGATAIEFFGFVAPRGSSPATRSRNSRLLACPGRRRAGLTSTNHGGVYDAPADVAVVISNTGRTKSLIEVARTTRANGAKVIAVTGSVSPLAAECDVALIVETLDNTNIYTPTISRIAALVVMDVLSTAVALRRGGAHEERFRMMKNSG